MRGASAVVLGMALFGLSSDWPASQVHEPGVACPAVALLVPTSEADAGALRSALSTIVPLQYPDPSEYQDYGITSVRMAAVSAAYGRVAAHFCGEEVARSTWIVELYFPHLEPSASMSQGQLFVAKTKDGWTSWFRYH